MDIGLIISSVLAIIFGLPTLIAFLKSKRTTIVYLEKENINLYNDVVSNFERLTIQYDGEEISDQLYLLRGKIICDGTNDITESDNFIELNLKSDAKWLEFNIVAKSQGFDPGIRIENNKLVLKFGLFKTGEYVDFESIIQNNEKPNINLHHRIPNIPNVSTLYESEIVKKRRLFPYAIIYFIVAGVIFWASNKTSLLDIKAYYNQNDEIVEDKDLIYSYPPDQVHLY